LGYLDFVQRIPNPEDKRERTYRISPEYLTVASSLLRYI
jgi:DNA-binding MarR family transcriptional regulator